MNDLLNICNEKVCLTFFCGAESLFLPLLYLFYSTQIAVSNVPTGWVLKQEESVLTWDHLRLQFLQVLNAAKLSTSIDSVMN